MSKLPKFKSNYKQISKQGANSTRVIYYNDYVNIVHNATKICWDKPPANTYADKLSYIEKRIDTGHESILEHSNIIIYIKLNDNYTNDLIELIPNIKYLNIKYNREKNFYNILIGGSIRGYKHLLKNTINVNNILLGLIKNELYVSSTKEFFVDLIDMGVMKDNFIDILLPPVNYEEFYDKISEDTINDLDFTNSLDTDSSKVNVKITNIDQIDQVYEKVSKYGFTYNNLMDVCTCTVLFKNISRAAATQLERHRNAQTWESQRYVNQSNAGFSDPADFVDKYDKDKKYSFNFAGSEVIATSKELGEEIIKLYEQLLVHGFNKEDARGYLPGNVQVDNIYMTFTYRNLIKFFELRTDTHAQAEIREFAVAIETRFDEYIDSIDGINHNWMDYLIPPIMYSESNYDYINSDEI